MPTAKMEKGIHMWFSYAPQILYKISADITCTFIGGPLFYFMIKNI